MNKNVLIGIGGVVVAGIGFGIYKFITKKSEDKVEDVEKIVEEVKDEIKETTTEEYVDELLKEEAELEEFEEQEKKQSMKDMNPFEDKVSESKEFAAINAMREAAGKEPLEVNKKFETFLGKNESKSVKESLDSIAENIKKDTKLKKSVLDILSE